MIKKKIRFFNRNLKSKKQEAHELKYFNHCEKTESAKLSFKIEKE
jgi:hypothetical protein